MTAIDFLSTLVIADNWIWMGWNVEKIFGGSCWDVVAFQPRPSLFV